jgi:hypothetical protein
MSKRSDNSEAGLKASAFARSISELRAKSARLTTRTRKLAQDMADLSALYSEEKAHCAKVVARRDKP